VGESSFVYANPRMAEIFGYEQDELIGMEASDLVKSDYRHILERNKQRRDAGENFSAHYEARGIKKDGTVIWVEVFSNSTQYKGKRGIIGTVSEITERKKAQEELEKSEANLRSIFNNTEIGYILVDQDFRVVAFNEVMRKGYAVASGINLDMGANLIDMVVPARKARAQEIFGYVKKEGKPYEYEISFGTGKEMLFYNVILVPVKNGDEVIGVCLSAYDITKRKMMEAERTEITNDLLGRNKDLEQFAHIVSHNLRAPVANILGLMNIMKLPSLTEKDRERVDAGLVESVTRLDTVVKDLNRILQVRHGADETYEEIGLSELVKDVKISVGNLITAGDVNIRTDFSEAPQLKARKSYMHSIFYNLVSNSIKYRRNGVPCEIAISSVRGNDNVALHFSDNGRGFDKEKAGDKIFGLYKRFHDDVEGKGVGLFMVKTQVEAMGGKISFDSKVNEGTSFVIRFGV
ncbi:MAG TPA: PAS domain S-box protein, partial [Bacteroidia bacterium]|nr:PAS domain S-box protein [Bacteroidia bacterium]